jgi:4-hydroxybenzoate polyprenyltransferase
MSEKDLDRQSQSIFGDSNILIEYLVKGYRVCLWWSLFPSLYATSAVIAASLSLSVFSLEVACIVFAVTFSIYNLNNIYDRDEDQVNAPRKAVFVRNHRQVIGGLVVAAYLTGLGISFLGGPYAPVVTLIPLLAGIIYSIDLIRAKDIVVLNTAIVSAALAGTVVALPLVFQHRFPVVPSLLLFMCFLLKFAITVELCNIPDIDGDRAAGVSTLPVVFGVRRTKVILYGLETVAFALVIVSIVYTSVPMGVLFVFAPTTLYSFGSIYITKQDPPFSKPSVYGDFQFFLMGLVALAVL